jgi:hypothetical protein
MTRSVDFMSFWKILNEFAKSHGLPEVLHREARDWFLEYQVTTNSTR